MQSLGLHTVPLCLFAASRKQHLQALHNNLLHHNWLAAAHCPYRQDSLPTA
jgi:hypothetical protein